MIVEHWTETAPEYFSLRAVDTAGQGAGLFVYPKSATDAEEEARARAWHDRNLVLIDVPDDAAVEVQRFAPGELGNEHEIVELFIPASRFDECEVWL